MPEQPFDFSEFRQRASPTGGPDDADRGLGAGGGLPDWGPPARGADVVPPSAGASAVGTLQTSGPPLPLLLAAGLLGLVGAVLAAALGSRVPVAFLAWALAGPVGFAVLARFTSVDTRRRAGAFYVAPGWTTPAYWAAAALTVVGLVAGSLQIALWAARQ